ncbi:MAG: molybdate ABC transporter substrate-binding protein [Planctomycetes bacterium]|nr:molybdate ABC transporter substrate-binding protein [Planctomycetota bacterium]
MRWSYALVLTMLGSCGVDSDIDVRVGAAASLRDVLGESKSAYEAQHPGTSVSIEFAASSVIARQLEAGAHLDVFVSADRENLDRVAGLLDAATVGPILGNALCIVARERLEHKPTSPLDLANLEGRIAVAGSAVPAGKHARTLLRDAGVFDAVEPKLVDAEDVRATLALVESKSVDVGIVYVTDGKAAKSARITWTATAGQGPNVVCFAGAHRDANDAARSFTTWLRESPEFRAIAVKHGFLAVEGK